MGTSRAEVVGPDALTPDPETGASQREAKPDADINWPVLERFLDCLPELLETRLFSAWGMRTQIRRGPAVQGRLKEFAKATENTGLSGHVASTSAPARGIVSLPSALVSAFVEFVLGYRSGAASPAAHRAITPFEASLSRPFVRQVLEAFAESVAPAGTLGLSLDGWGPAEEVVDGPALHVPLTLAFAGTEGDVLLILPLSFLAPLNDALAGIFHGVRAESDDIWRLSLQRQVVQARVTLLAVLHEQVLPLGVIQRLAVGQSLTFDAPAEPVIRLAVAGVDIARGKLGRAGARIAVRLETGISARKETEQ